MATVSTPDFQGTTEQSSASSIQDKTNTALNGLNGQLKNFGDAAANQLGKLSTTQKVVGGLALAAGISWLSRAMRR